MILLVEQNQTKEHSMNKTYKVVYNAEDYGSLKVSVEAAKRLVELGITELSEFISMKRTEIVISDSIPRHDKRLVQVVEELGRNAAVYRSRPAIACIEDSEYYIDCYNGREIVVSKNDHIWCKIEE